MTVGASASTPDDAPASVAVVGAGPVASACRATLLAASYPVTLLRGAADVTGRTHGGGPAPAAAAIDLVSLGRDGLDMLGEVRAAWPGARVIVIAGSGSMSLARSAIRAGAFDFIAWPEQREALDAVLRNAMTAVAPPERDDILGAAEMLAGPSEAIAMLRQEAVGHAASKAALLIKGERGVGKHRLGEVLHRLSGRKGGLRRLDFSSADPNVAARLIDDQAEALAEGRMPPGTTLMLERVCALPAGMQSRALRLIDLLASAPGIRVICTARDGLDAAAADGRFRENVYHRLQVCVLSPPPLRARGRDVLELAERGLTRRAPHFASIHPEVARAFLRHPWPDNLRQLDRTLAWMSKRLADGVAVPSALPPEFIDTIDAQRPWQATVRPAEAAPAAAAASLPATPPAWSDRALPLSARIAPLVGESLAQVEGALIEATLLRCGGSAEAAARMLGVSPATIYRRKAAARRAAAACNPSRSGRP